MILTKKCRFTPMPCGFSLIEMLIVIGIILLLAGILLPSVAAIRSYAHSVTCMNNMRQCGQGLMGLATAKKNCYPAAYQKTTGRDARYTTWGGMLLAKDYLCEESFTCPAFAEGGLPRTNFTDGDGEEGQVAETADVEDVAPVRCAFTVNEAILPCPRFACGSEGIARLSRRVSLTEVEPDVILLTEFDTNWRVLSPGNHTCCSYKPVHGLVGIGPMGSDRFNLNDVGFDDRPCFQSGAYRRYRPSNLIAQPVENLKNPPRLNLIGRNHGSPDEDGFRRSSFVFTDGHAESLTVPETLENGSWGHKVYSVTGDQRIVD